MQRDVNKPHTLREAKPFKMVDLASLPKIQGLVAFDQLLKTKTHREVACARHSSSKISVLR